MEDLHDDREAARRTVERFAPITKPWAFEAEPASTKPLLDFYIGAAKTCDVFVLIMGRNVTEPVRIECQTALDHGKAILVFRKEVPDRLPEVDALLKRIDRKYDTFNIAGDPCLMPGHCSYFLWSSNRSGP